VNPYSLADGMPILRASTAPLACAQNLYTLIQDKAIRFIWVTANAAAVVPYAYNMGPQLSEATPPGGFFKINFTSLNGY